jgi:hypothetical protein
MREIRISRRLTFPGLFKITLRKVPARKAGTLIRNPATGEMMKGAAKSTGRGFSLARWRAASGSSFGHRFICQVFKWRGGATGRRKVAALRRVKNRVINKYPALIVRCANDKDVQLAVDFARHKGLLTAVRSGGHSFAGHGVCEGGMVIDLSNMKRVQIDPVHENVRIEPGVLAGELDCLTQSFRMVVPLGSCPTVGVAGYGYAAKELIRLPL